MTPADTPDIVEEAREGCTGGPGVRCSTNGNCTTCLLIGRLADTILALRAAQFPQAQVQRWYNDLQTVRNTIPADCDGKLRDARRIVSDVVTEMMHAAYPSFPQARDEGRAVEAITTADMNVRSTRFRAGVKVSTVQGAIDRLATRELTLECALILARKRFAEYADNHRAKSPPDTVKAKANDDMAAMCHDALYAAPSPPPTDAINTAEGEAGLAQRGETATGLMRKPGEGWTLSDEAKAEIEATKQAQRQGARDAQNIIVGSPASPPQAPQEVAIQEALADYAEAKTIPNTSTEEDIAWAIATAKTMFGEDGTEDGNDVAGVAVRAMERAERAESALAAALTPRELDVERVALAIQAADNERNGVEGAADGLSGDVSDWGAFLARAALRAIGAPRELTDEEAERGARAYCEALRQEAVMIVGEPDDYQPFATGYDGLDATQRRYLLAAIRASYRAITEEPAR